MSTSKRKIELADQVELLKGQVATFEASQLKVRAIVARIMSTYQPEELSKKQLEIVVKATTI